MVRFPKNAKIFDTREILPVMEDNIDGFRVEDKEIGTHDVNVSYRGVKFQVFAGSIRPYEIPIGNINNILIRIMEEDLKVGVIKESEKASRLEVLKNYVFK